MNLSMTCYNCFREKTSGEQVCPYCGYNSAYDIERYPHALPQGTILNGKYIIGRVLGQGGFGITYLAAEWKSGISNGLAENLVAIKEFFPETLASRSNAVLVSTFGGSKDADFAYGKTAFEDEANTLANLDGIPNIVRVYEAFQENNTAYFAMEYVRGNSLEERISAYGEKIAWEEASKILTPVMEALCAVHKSGVIHRDIKPENIVIGANNVVKLLDFGAARYSVGEKTHSLTVLLTPGFAPKEQYFRNGKQGPWTDVYAMAATIYYAITGVKPPEALERDDDGGDNLIPPNRLNAGLSAAQEAVLLKGLAISSQERWQTMEEFKQHLLKNMPPPKETSISSAKPVPNLRRKFWLPACVILLLAIGVGIYSISPYWPFGSETAPNSPVNELAEVTSNSTNAQDGADKNRTVEYPAISDVAGISIVTQEDFSESDWNYEIYDNHVEIIAYTGNETNLVIPNSIKGKSVTSIGISAFEPSSSEESVLVTVTLPDTVTTIKESAFALCQNLTEINLPANLSSVGDSAFANTGIRQIVIPAGVTTIEDGTFAECYDLESLTFSDSLKYIGDSAFLSCTKLKTVKLPENLSYLGHWAFCQCTGLTEISIPNGLPEIGEQAFSGCSSLEKVNFGEGVESIGDFAFFECSSLSDIMIPNSVKKIGKNAFLGTSLTKVVLPAGVELGENSFSSETQVLPLDLEPEITEHETTETATTQIYASNQNGHYVITGYDGSVSVLEIAAEYNSIPVTEIGQLAFEKNATLTEVVIPDGVTSIGAGAFSECINLAKVTIPRSVTSIGDGAFYHTALTRVSFPENLSSIGRSAFEGTGLISVTIPSSVIYIGSKAFADVDIRNVSVPLDTDLADDAFDTDVNISYFPVIKAIR